MRPTAEVVVDSNVDLGSCNDRAVYKEILRLVLLEKQLLIFIITLFILKL